MRTLTILLVVGLMGCYGEVHRFEEDSGTSDTAGDMDSSTDTSVDAPDVTDAPFDSTPPPGACPTGWDCLNAEVPVFEGVDILVVVDNSRSMVEEQATMAAQFPSLIENLLDPSIDPESGRPVHIPITDLHIGVVSTDMGTGGYVIETCDDPIDGDDGILLHAPTDPECAISYPKFLAYDVDSPDPGAVAAMAEAFGCIARLGDGGCGFEQQLEAALKALTTHAAGANSGFLRDDSVLMIIWLTDEEDCSVSDPTIFDASDPTLGHLNLRCFNYPEMVYPVSRYISGLGALRMSSPWPLVLGMIVGVPFTAVKCNGFGDEISGCLDEPEMQEEIDPLNPTRLTPSCNTMFGEAFPPRRFVDIAQEYGPDAYVHSICQDDYLPAMEALSGKVSGLADVACEASIVELEKHPSDPCLCISDCHVVHVLADDGACPPLLEEWDHDGDTIPNNVTNGAGSRVTACEVPQAHTRVLSCDLGCHDPHQIYQPHLEGWYYNQSFSGVACPTVSFTPGYDAPDGAHTFVACP